ncbi:MAG: CHAT domain-containing tetratricopeptide repeat protein [Acidobacteriota bacterium]
MNRTPPLTTPLLRSWCLVLLTLIAGAMHGSPAPLLVAPGVVIRDRIGGKTPSTYMIEVPAETAVRVTIRREGLYLVFQLRDGAGPVLSVDDSNGPAGTVMLAVPVRLQAATYTLDLRPMVEEGCGSYELSVDQAPADETSRMIADAQRQLFDADRVENAGDGQSVRKALQLFDASIENAERAGDPQTAAAALYHSSMTHGMLGHTAESMARMEQVVPRFRELGMRGAEARATGRLGENARRVGEVESAERFFAEALPLSRKYGDFEGECDTLNNWGLLLTQTGRWDEAIAMLQQAIPLAERTASFQVKGALHHNVGYAYGEMGDYQRALDAYGRSLEVKRVYGDTPRRTARTLLAQAGAYVGLGDGQKAWRTLEEAQRLFDLSGDPNGIGTASLYRARMQLQRDDIAGAEESAAKALLLMREVRDRRGEASALLILGEVDVRGRRFDEARERLLRSVEISRDAIDPRSEAAGLYWLGKSMQSSGRIDEAIVYARQAVDVVESMRQGITDPELRSTYLGTLRRYFDLLVDLLMSRHQTAPEGGFAAEAFRVNERSRARTLLESLFRSTAGVSKGVPPELLQRERSLRRQLGAKEAYRAQLLRGDRTRPELLDADALLESLRQRYRAVQTEIRAGSSAYAALEFPEAVALPHVQEQLLSADTVLLEYHLGFERSYVWAVSQDAVHVEMLPSESAIEALAREYHDLLQRNPTVLEERAARALRRRVAAAGEKLARAVFRPLAANVRGKRLLVVPDGVLHYVPFGAFPDEQGKPLITGHEITYLPSATLLDTHRRASRAEPRPATIAVFADPVFQRSDPRFSAPAAGGAVVSRQPERGSDFRRLQFSRREADAILRAAAGRKELRALGFDATKKTLTQSDLRPFDILHIATHGVVDAEWPERSGLVLSLYDQKGGAVDGFVRLDEIYNLDLHADLVVLSACRTALGKAVYGEGIIGLTRGFMYGGARRVVATVWSVDDRATAQLMAHFYDRLLRQPSTPASALRSAQQEMLRDPRWSDPYFWAAFTIHGD